MGRSDQATLCTGQQTQPRRRHIGSPHRLVQRKRAAAANFNGRGSLLVESGRGASADRRVELLVAIEAEVSSESTDDFAESLEARTFAEYVAHLASSEAA